VPKLDPPVLAIFDHDGVLVDSLELHQNAWMELGRRENLPITAEFIHETFGMTNPSIFERLLGGSVHADELQRYGDIKEECYRDAARKTITLMDGVRPFLDALTAQGVALAIGSSGVLPNLHLTVETCGLSGRFAAIASLEDIQRGKPDPQVFLVAARKSGIAPSACVVFEDATVGIQAAKAAGMLAVGVTTTHSAQSLFAAGADHVIHHFSECDVPTLIAELQARAGGRSGDEKRSIA
jgi:HAD superfamily hydrolase (TIGR01509 family)